MYMTEILTLQESQRKGDEIKADKHGWSRQVEKNKTALEMSAKKKDLKLKNKKRFKRCVTSAYVLYVTD